MKKLLSIATLASILASSAFAVTTHSLAYSGVKNKVVKVRYQKSSVFTPAKTSKTKVTKRTDSVLDKINTTMKVLKDKYYRYNKKLSAIDRDIHYLETEKRKYAQSADKKINALNEKYQRYSKIVADLQRRIKRTKNRKFANYLKFKYRRYIRILSDIKTQVSKLEIEKNRKLISIDKKINVLNKSKTRYAKNIRNIKRQIAKLEIEKRKYSKK